MARRGRAWQSRGMAVRVERQGAVTTVVIDRASVRNAVDRPTADALVAAFTAFEVDPEAKVAVLAGDHGTFCAGADLKSFATDRRNRVAPDGDGPMGPTRTVLAKPVIAAIAGHAVAGGLELALWCDLRVAEDDAVLGVFCRRWGVPLIDGGTIRLPRLIGQARALDLILTGRAVGAAEALAADLARLPQGALLGDRLSCYEQWDLPFADALANELRHGVAALAEGLGGAARFAGGAGRHGASE